MANLFRLPKEIALDSGGVPFAGAKCEFFLTGTSTNTDTYTDSALSTPHANPVVADANGVFAPIYLDPDVTYKATLSQSDDTLIYTVDPVSEHLTQANIGLVLYPKTSAETTSGVTILDYSKFPSPIRDVSRYVSDNTGATDVTSEMQAAIDVSDSYVMIPEGTYKTTAALTFDSGHIIQGGGRGKTIISNEGGATIDTFTNIAGARGAVIQGMTITGVASSARDAIRFTANFGNIQLIDLDCIGRGGSGIDASAGDSTHLYMRDVRAHGPNYCFNFNSGGVINNTVTAVNCYAVGTLATGTPTVGWSFSNVAQASLEGCSADLVGTGFELAARVNLIGCTSEQNTTYGVSIAGAGNIILVGHYAFSEQTAFIISAAADVTMINCKTASTVGSNSLEMTASATGDNLLIAPDFDKAISANAAAKLIQIEAEKITFHTDANLYRSAANIVKSDDKIIAVAGLGVGNQAANTNTPSGATAYAVEVFDASGVSIGFVPVYSAQW